VGVAQLEQLPRYIEKKREIFARYRAELGGYHNISFVDGATAGAHNYWLTNIVLEPDRGLTALEMVKILRACNIEARPVWYPNHAQRPNQGCLAYRISRAAAVVEYTVSLPSSVGLTAEEQERVVAAVKQAYDGARIKA
jgi:perosamine synthetase